MERVWEQDRHFLKVLAPARFEHENVERELSKKKENEFLAELQHFREALALLSAVGHVDKAGWRYLLEHHCDVELEVEGDEVFEEEIRVRFQLDLSKGKTTYTYPKKVKDDLVRWFGTAQRTEASEDFLETLQQIADLAGNLPTDKPGLDLVIPVSVWFSLTITDGGDVKPLEDIWIAEVVAQKKWAAFDDVDVKLESLRCTCH